mgnify:CR=1 FL=1
MIKDIIFGEEKEVTVGSRLTVRGMVNLGDLEPDDVQVELYFGGLNPAGDILEGAALPMYMAEKRGDGVFVYEGHMLCLKSGQFGCTVRVIPVHRSLVRKFEPGLIMWA